MMEVSVETWEFILKLAIVVASLALGGWISSVVRSKKWF